MSGSVLTAVVGEFAPAEQECKGRAMDEQESAQAPVTQESDENAAPSTQPHTWADGFGVWHVRVRRSIVSPLIAARRALRDELQARDAQVARNVWLHPVRVEEMDDEETMVYRENDERS